MIKLLFATKKLYDYGKKSEIHKEPAARVSLDIAECHEDTCNKSLALRSYTESLELYSETSNDLVASTIHFKLGSLHYDQGQYKQAITHLQSCIKIFQENKSDDDRLILAMKALCSAFEQVQDFPAALYIYDELVSLLKANEPSRDDEISEVLLSQGNILLKSSEIDRALNIYEKSLCLKRNFLIPDEIGIARLLTLMAEVNVRKNNFNVAAELLREVGVLM